MIEQHLTKLQNHSSNGGAAGTQTFPSVSAYADSHSHLLRVVLALAGSVFGAYLLTACSTNSPATNAVSSPKTGTPKANDRSKASGYFEVSAASTTQEKSPGTTVAKDQTRSRFVLGSPAPGLNFSVADNSENAQLNTPSTTQNFVPIAITDKETAIRSFATAVVEDDHPKAFALLSELDRAQIGSPAKFGELLAKSPSWLSFSVEGVSQQSTSSLNSTSSLDSSSKTTPADTALAVLTVRQQPSIDETLGVVGPSARVEFSMKNENGGWHAVWRRHKVSQNFLASEAKLLPEVGAWAEARRACTAKGEKPFAEYLGGMVGEVWLAETLCKLPAPITVQSIGDFDSILDPQAIFDAFGSDAYQWARVVKINSPTPFYAIAAPLGEHWVVVGLSSFS